MKIGFIGCGVMGLPMAGHLAEKGWLVGVHSRTQAKAQKLLGQGITWFDGPKEILQACDVICTMLGFPEDVSSVYLGPDGLIEQASSQHLFIDFTTTKPSLAESIWSACQTKQAHSLDAPVSGGDVGAQKATLSIMVGGEKTAFQRALPIFEALGKTVIHAGRPGAGQHTKMCNQVVIASTMVGVCGAFYMPKELAWIWKPCFPLLDLEPLVAGP